MYEETESDADSARLRNSIDSRDSRTYRPRVSRFSHRESLQHESSGLSQENYSGYSQSTSQSSSDDSQNRDEISSESANIGEYGSSEIETTQASRYRTRQEMLNDNRGRRFRAEIPSESETTNNRRYGTRREILSETTNNRGHRAIPSETTNNRGFHTISSETTNNRGYRQRNYFKPQFNASVAPSADCSNLLRQYMWEESKLQNHVERIINVRPRVDCKLPQTSLEQMCQVHKIKEQGARIRMQARENQDIVRRLTQTLTDRRAAVDCWNEAPRATNPRQVAIKNNQKKIDRENSHILERLTAVCLLQFKYAKMAHRIVMLIV